MRLPQHQGPHPRSHFDDYLEQFEANIIKNGGHVHYASNAEEANAFVVQIANQTNSKLVVKSKSMVSEETELNHALIAAGIETVETDLGELIVQVANDHPSHLVYPIVHMRAKQIGEVFAKFFNAPFTDDPQTLAEMARVYLRDRFNKADMGVSGVNFGVAETGSIVLCTNEGNGRMCTSRMRVHVALKGMEKLIPRFQDLPRLPSNFSPAPPAANPLTQYSNIITGPKRLGEFDGPDEFHVIIMDNGRFRILASDYRDTLRCIRCGCLPQRLPHLPQSWRPHLRLHLPGPIGRLHHPLFNVSSNITSISHRPHPSARLSRSLPRQNQHPRNAHRHEGRSQTRRQNPLVRKIHFPPLDHRPEE